MTIRLVLFDALHTLVKPRAPVFIQYANVFEPHLGKLNPDSIKSSFKIGKITTIFISLFFFGPTCVANEMFTKILVLHFFAYVCTIARVKRYNRSKSNDLPMPAVLLSGGVRS